MKPTKVVGKTRTDGFTDGFVQQANKHKRTISLSSMLSLFCAQCRTSVTRERVILWPHELTIGGSYRSWQRPHSPRPCRGID
jgi:hypothetical protein